MKDKYRVKHGGLMRCCLLTLDDAMVAAEHPPAEGDTLKCTYCTDPKGMIFSGGAWQWNKPSANTLRAESAR